MPVFTILWERGALQGALAAEVEVVLGGGRRRGLANDRAAALTEFVKRSG
jgi:hypothetical protein